MDGAGDTRRHISLFQRPCHPQSLLLHPSLTTTCPLCKLPGGDGSTELRVTDRFVLYKIFHSLLGKEAGARMDRYMHVRSSEFLVSPVSMTLCACACVYVCVCVCFTRLSSPLAFITTLTSILPSNRTYYSRCRLPNTHPLTYIHTVSTTIR